MSFGPVQVVVTFLPSFCFVFCRLQCIYDVKRLVSIEKKKQEEKNTHSPRVQMTCLAFFGPVQVVITFLQSSCFVFRRLQSIYAVVSTEQGVTRVTPRVTFHHTAPVTCNTVPVTGYLCKGTGKNHGYALDTAVINIPRYTVKNT